MQTLVVTWPKYSVEAWRDGACLLVGPDRAYADTLVGLGVPVALTPTSRRYTAGWDDVLQAAATLQAVFPLAVISSPDVDLHAATGPWPDAGSGVIP